MRFRPLESRKRRDGLAGSDEAEAQEPRNVRGVIISGLARRRLSHCNVVVCVTYFSLILSGFLSDKKVYVKENFNGIFRK